MTLLEQIKKSTRISHTALDETISSDMKAAALDLERVGIKPYEKSEDEKIILKDNELIYKVIELFCKAQANYEGNGETYQKAYERMRDSLSLCGDYNA